MWNPFRRKPAAPQLPAGTEQRADSAERREDGVINRVTGQGTARDKRTYSHYQAEPIDNETALELWRGNDLAGTIIESIVDDAMRKGYEITISDDKEQADDVVKSMNKLRSTFGDANETVTMARKYERAFGGAAIMPMCNDGSKSLSLPLNEENISKMTHLVLFEPRELTPSRWYASLEDTKYRMPSAYRLHPLLPQGAGAMSGTEIHESRLIIFPGRKLSSRVVREALSGWGDSELTPVDAALAEFDFSWSSASALLADFAQGVMYMKGMAKMYAEGNASIVNQRLLNLDLKRSTMKIIPVDGEDKFERVATPMSGLADFIDRMMWRVAAAAKMPATKLWRRSPAGENSTGESDMALWDDQVATEQTNKLETPITRLIRLMLLAKNGPTAGKLPKNWAVKWRPLRQPTELQSAQARYYQMQTDTGYVKEGIVSEEEVAHSRWGGDSYSFETIIDWKARAAGKEIAPPAVTIQGETLGPDGKPIEQPMLGAPPPGAAPQPNAAGAAQAGDKAAPDKAAADKAAGEAQQKRADELNLLADRLPDRFRYDVLDVAMQKEQGVMIALFLPAEIAQKVALRRAPDGVTVLPPEDLHVTLAYLGKDLPDIAVQRATGIAYDMAMRHAPVIAKLAGSLRFAASESSDNRDVVGITVDSYMVECLRRHLVSCLECMSIPVSKEHGFLPHVTLAYVDRDAKPPVIEASPIDVTFPTIVVAAGVERVELEFKGEDDELSMKRMGRY